MRATELEKSRAALLRKDKLQALALLNAMISRIESTEVSQVTTSRDVRN